MSEDDPLRPLTVVLLLISIFLSKNIVNILIQIYGIDFSYVLRQQSGPEVIGHTA